MLIKNFKITSPDTTNTIPAARRNTSVVSSISNQIYSWFAGTTSMNSTRLLDSNLQLILCRIGTRMRIRACFKGLCREGNEKLKLRRGGFRVLRLKILRSWSRISSRYHLSRSFRQRISRRILTGVRPRALSQSHRSKETVAPAGHSPRLALSPTA